MQFWIARWITRILNPLIMPSVTILILMFSGAQFTASIAPEGKWMVPLMIAGTTFVLPTLIFIIMIRRGMISDVEIPNRLERIMPSMITAIFFYATYHMLTRTHIHPIFTYTMLAATLLIIICMLITYFWKISLHMSAMGAMTGTIIGASLLFGIPMTAWAIIAILLSGIVGFARLRLLAHTHAQVYAGFVLGFVFFAGMFVLQSF